MSTANLSSLSILTNIIAAPMQAFAAIKERPTVWLPLTILVVLSAAVSIAYTLSVDMAWMLEQTLSQAQNLSAADRERAIQAALKLPPAFYAGIGAVGSVFGLPALVALTALYYTGVSVATRDGVKFDRWIALVAWCAIPTVFGLAASLVHVLSGDSRFMRPEDLNPFSFASMLGLDLTNAKTLQRALLARDVTSIWSIVLSIVGYQTFSKRSLAFSAAVVLAPLALIIAIAMILAAR